MKYVTEIFANGKSISKFKSSKEFDYDKADSIVENYFKENLPKGKPLASSLGGKDTYYVSFDEKEYKSICVCIKRNQYIDINDSEGNPIIIDDIYEGHEPNSNEIYRYGVYGSSCLSSEKDSFYIRNLNRAENHYDWSSGSPKLIPAIGDKHFKISEESQKMIDKYELKTIKK